MKYIVEVNAKYLVSIEADSAPRAEHAILDYDGIWDALAFDSEAMKTDCFRGACLGCETISMKELETLSENYRKAYAEKAAALDARQSANDEVRRLEALLEEAKETLKTANHNLFAANDVVAEANEAIGVRED